MKTEDVDKLLRTIDDSLPVYEDVKEAHDDDGKISFGEGSMLAIKHSGKVLNFIRSIKEIGEEIADLDPKEAEVVMEAIAESYGQGNTEVKQGAKELVVGMAGIRTGIVRIITAKQFAHDAAQEEN